MAAAAPTAAEKIGMDNDLVNVTDVEQGWIYDFLGGGLCPAGVELHGGARVVAATGLLLGRRAFATIPRKDITKTSFTMTFVFRLPPGLVSHRQILLGDWTHPWSFLVYIHAGGRVGTNLRKNIFSHGSDPDQDLITLGEAEVPPECPPVQGGAWTHVAVAWDREHGVCTSYVNGVFAESSAARMPAANMDLQTTAHPRFFIGCKEDSRGDINSGFEGDIALAHMVPRLLDPQTIAGLSALFLSRF